FTCSLLSVFLTLFLTRVACNEPCLFKRRAKICVEFEQRTGNAVTNCSSLSRRSAAIDIHQNVEFTGRFRQFKWLKNDYLQRFIREVSVEFAVVHLNVAVSGTKVNARCRSLSAARAVILNICHI